jgi:hypothetical protein
MDFKELIEQHRKKRAVKRAASKQRTAEFKEKLEEFLIGEEVEESEEETPFFDHFRK